MRKDTTITLIKLNKMTKEKHPLMYKGWLIKKRHDINKLYAYNLAKDIYINPLFKEWSTLKRFINNTK